MSKIQKIKDMLKEGKVSVKGTEYLLWVIEQKEIASQFRNKAAQRVLTENRMLVHAANVIEQALADFDTGKLQMFEYEKQVAFAKSLVD